MMTNDDGGGEGGKKRRKIDDVICERPLGYICDVCANVTE